jgi:hypothetical protein
MSRGLKVLLWLTLLAACAAPAWPQAVVPGPPPVMVAPPPPIPPGVAPAWIPVPGSHKVFYAPNLPGDLFLLHKRHYYYYGGVWYQSKNPMGPWGPVQKKLPPALYRVNRSYFKTPPPW